MCCDEEEGEGGRQCLEGIGTSDNPRAVGRNSLGGGTAPIEKSDEKSWVAAGSVVQYHGWPCWCGVGRGRGFSTAVGQPRVQQTNRKGHRHPLRGDGGIPPSHQAGRLAGWC
jgi:hypothetical protein